MIYSNLFPLAFALPIVNAAISLGTAGNFGVLAGSAITNTGATRIVGDVGVYPGTAITGLSSGDITGSFHSADAVAIQAQSDATIAYNAATALQSQIQKTSQDLAGQTLFPAAYNFPSTATLGGVLTLDGLHNSSSFWVFKIGSALNTGSGASVRLINGATARHILWRVGSSAVFGSNTSFAGNVLALTAITAAHAGRFNGGLYTLNAAITLDNNTITRSGPV